MKYFSVNIIFILLEKGIVYLYNILYIKLMPANVGLFNETNIYHCIKFKIIKFQFKITASRS